MVIGTITDEEMEMESMAALQVGYQQQFIINLLMRNMVDIYFVSNQLKK